MKVKVWLAGLLLLTIIPAVSGNNLTDMRGLALQNVKIPFYKDNKLQLVAFSKTGERQNQVMLAQRTWLDILLENADVDKIVDGWQGTLYLLDSPLASIVEFWKPRYLTSQAVIYTEHCSIDQKQGEAYGDDPVFLRAPMFDLNGIGFHANFKASVIEINSEVKIVARKSDADPRKLLTGTKFPAAYQVIHATSDSLRLDTANNELMLIGNVKVIDGKSTLTCDRLTVFMNDREPQNKSSEPMLKGVSRILADGEVVLNRLPDSPDGAVVTAKSEHLEYILADGIIALTGDDVNPEVQHGKNDRVSGKRIELLRHEDRAFVTGDCKVTSVSGDGNNAAPRMITSRRGEFDNRARISTFYDDVKVTDADTVMDCGLLRIYLAPRDKGGDVEKIFADKSVKIVHTGEKTNAAAPGGKRKTETAIASQQAQLDYKSNKLVFYRNVKVRDEKSTLDCDRLDLFLADRKNQNRKTPAAGGVNTLGGKNKTLTQAIANGSVVMVNNQDEMHTDLMTLVFRDLPEGAKPAPGMLQSGGVQLIKILCDGSVHAFSRDKKVRRMMKSEHAMSDMLKDYSEFHGKVSVYDGNNEVYCRDMYVFTEKSLPESKAEKLPVKKTVSIDADPFALDAGENSVPSRMALSKDIDLKRIVCKKDVELVKKDADGKTQRAGGDQLVYTAATQESVLTAEPPNRPWLRSDGRLQYCDIIRGNMETGDLRGIGSVQVVPDQKQ